MFREIGVDLFGDKGSKREEDNQNLLPDLIEDIERSLLCLFILPA